MSDRIAQMTTRGVSDDGEGVEGAQMSRDERGREKEDGQAISGPGAQADAILAMRWLRLSAAPASKLLFGA
jgi:hypothetical protein